MTYGEIRTQFINILNRSDCTNALADTFITQGIQRSQQLLHLITQERISSTTIGPAFTGIAIPADFIKPIAVYYNESTGSRKLTRVSLSDYLERQDYVGKPEVWTRDNTKFLLRPTPSEGDVIKLLYYGEFEAFADDNDETPLSLVSPHLFIYGGLVFAADYFLDDRSAIWEDKYMKTVAELQGQSDDEELAGGAVIQPAYNYPYEDQY